METTRSLRSHGDRYYSQKNYGGRKITARKANSPFSILYLEQKQNIILQFSTKESIKIYPLVSTPEGASLIHIFHVFISHPNRNLIGSRSLTVVVVMINCVVTTMVQVSILSDIYYFSISPTKEFALFVSSPSAKVNKKR